MDDKENKSSCSDCGPPKSFPNAQIKQDVGPSSPVGTRLTYTCLPGYEPTSQIRPVTECLETSQWSEVSVSCRGRRCPVPNIEDGRIVEDSDLRLGAQITFICNEGYRPIGQNGARCVLRGGAVVWDRDPPHCQRIPCYPPPTIAHGTHDGQEDYAYSSVVTYRCAKPFSLIGSKTLVCVSDRDLNGKWSKPAPECKEVNCRTPEVSNGVMQTSYQPSYTYQDKIAFGCVQGYRLKGNTGLITCGADSTWQPRLPECIPGTPPTTSTGDVEGGTSTGSNVSVPVVVGSYAGQPKKFRGAWCFMEGARDARSVESQDLFGDTLATINAEDIRASSPVSHDSSQVASRASPPSGDSQPQDPDETTVSLERGASDPTQGSCGPPTRLYFAELMDEYKDKTSFPVGSIVKYKCRPGYFSFKTSLKSLKCLESLEWSQAPKFCKEKSCGNPGEPANGRLIVPKDLHFGSTVNFICDEGHRLIGRSSIRCMIFAQKVDWSGEIPLCQRIPCYPPPDIPHGKHDGGYDRDYHYGDAVTYTCDRDYPLVGKRFIHCTTKDGVNGVWSGHPACGAIQCSIPQRITNGKYNSQSSEVFTEGAFVEYSCEPGYKLIGEARLYCTKSGSWSFPAPYCEVMGCVGLEIQNGRITSSKVLFKPGEIITFECDPDFDLLGNQVIQCQSDSTWDSPVPTCVNVLPNHSQSTETKSDHPAVQNNQDSSCLSALDHYFTALTRSIQRIEMLLGINPVYAEFLSTQMHASKESKGRRG
uniref:complement component receptor 1-like protein n=1 Tax=Euleptes europaea TaxID=460621 RepID=UPI00254222B6|nr:complement component receptor 1-like protein [Euleptes europaea]